MMVNQENFSDSRGVKYLNGVVILEWDKASIFLLYFQVWPFIKDTTSPAISSLAKF